MKKQKNKSYLLNELPLDEYEGELKSFLDEGKFVRAKNFQATKRMLEEAAKNYIELQRTKRITLRVKNSDLFKVKVKAQQHQIPYQRLINTLIHQYAEGLTHIVI